MLTNVCKSVTFVLIVVSTELHLNEDCEAFLKLVSAFQGCFPGPGNRGMMIHY